MSDNAETVNSGREVICSLCGKTGNSETGLWVSDDMLDLCWSCYRKERAADRRAEKAWELFARMAGGGISPSATWCFVMADEFIEEAKRQRGRK